MDGWATHTFFEHVRLDANRSGTTNGVAYPTVKVASAYSIDVLATDPPLSAPENYQGQDQSTPESLHSSYDSHYGTTPKDVYPVVWDIYFHYEPPSWVLDYTAYYASATVYWRLDNQQIEQLQLENPSEWVFTVDFATLFQRASTPIIKYFAGDSEWPHTWYIHVVGQLADSARGPLTIKFNFQSKQLTEQLLEPQATVTWWTALTNLYPSPIPVTGVSGELPALAGRDSDEELRPEWELVDPA